MSSIDGYKGIDSYYKNHDIIREGYQARDELCNAECVEIAARI